MAEFKYTPDEVKVHSEGAIARLCSAFQSHEAGIPEWLKNSSDEYARRGTESPSRIVVLFFASRSRELEASISCLDFGGMNSTAIEERFRIWGDPYAARSEGRSKGVQGGHGNGGKCYMTQMFRDHAVIHTVSDSKGCKYGVAAGSVAFGYVPDASIGKGFDVLSLEDELERALQTIGLTASVLPRVSREALASVSGFTLVSGVSPRGYEKRIPVKRLVESICEDPQMVETLSACRVFVVDNGKLWNNGKALTLPVIEPKEGYKDERRIEIPSRLEDPATNDEVSTTSEGKTHRGDLILRTSARNMSYKKRTARHVVTFRSANGFLGFVPVSELDITSSYANFVYGKCHLDSLEPFKMNDRTRLARGPLTRAVEEFITREIQRLTQEMEQRDKRHYDKEERNALSEMNAALDRWKNQFLVELVGGGKGIGDPPIVDHTLPVGIPERIELLITYHRMGRGVYMQPRLRFYDKDGKRVRPVPIEWQVDDPNIFIVNELGLISSYCYGSTRLRAVSLDGRTSSNEERIDIVHIRDIRLVPPEVEVGVGGRAKVDAVCTLDDGTECYDVLLIWTEDDSSVVRISSSGMVFGAGIGETRVCAGDDAIMASKSSLVRVVQKPGGGSGEGRGRGYARILVSGVDKDPDTNEIVEFTSGDPPIWRRIIDIDRNIWWINSASPLAQLYLDKGRDFGYESREWRIYHVERIIDVVSQIALEIDPDQSDSSAAQWFISRGDKLVEIQERAVTELARFIEEGELPKV